MLGSVIANGPPTPSPIIRRYRRSRPHRRTDLPGDVRVTLSRRQEESCLEKVQTIVVVAVAYFALGAFSAFFAYSDQDAWSVWLTSGLGLGLVLGRGRSDWTPALGGGFLGGRIFG